MTEEEILARAYFVMGIDAGSSMEEVTNRYKRMALAWHSDRFPASQKEQAEEEMKKINNARDELRKHFTNSHKASGYCACRPSAGADQPHVRTRTGQAPGPGKRRTTQENNTEEAEARRRNEERARRAAEDAAAAKAREAAAAAQKTATPQQSKQSAEEQAKLADDERLRWKISICMVIAWIGLNAFGAFSMNAKSWWHDASWKWERDHPSTPYVAPAPAPEPIHIEAPTNNNVSPPPGEANFGSTAPPTQTYTIQSQPWKPSYSGNSNSGTLFNPTNPFRTVNPNSTMPNFSPSQTFSTDPNTSMNPLLKKQP
jgi:curved DNA-binding protein CbpA